MSNHTDSENESTSSSSSYAVGAAPPTGPYAAPPTGPYAAGAAAGSAFTVFDPSKYVKGSPKRIWTAEEQAEKLTNLIEIEECNWEHIKYGTRVQYYGADGGFRAGGSVLKNPYVYKPKNAEKHYTYMVLRNGFNTKEPGYVQWMVKYEDIRGMYVKPGADFMTILNMLHTAVKGLNKNIQTLATQIKMLDNRVAKIESRRR